MAGRQEAFLDLCFLYGDFNRPALFEAILQSFIDSASPAELIALRRAIRDRAKSLRRTDKQGRPRAEHHSNWIHLSAQLVWQHEILHRSWRQIAAAAGIKPTPENIRTLRRRRDHYAALLWSALPPVSDDPKTLSKALDSKRLQRFLQSRLALPFDSHPAECKRLILKLFARGLEIASRSKL